MSELLSPICRQENAALFENLQTRLRETAPARQTDATGGLAVKMRMRPAPKALDDAGALAGVSQVRAEAERGMDMASVHGGLDPQRVAKLLSLLE